MIGKCVSVTMKRISMLMSIKQQVMSAVILLPSKHLNQEIKRIKVTQQCVYGEKMEAKQDLGTK